MMEEAVSVFTRGDAQKDVQTAWEDDAPEKEEAVPNGEVSPRNRAPLGKDASPNGWPDSPVKNGASPGAKINTVVKIPGRDSAGITEKIPSDRAKDGAVDQAKVAGVAGTSAPQAVTSKESRRKLWQKVAERVHGSQDGKVQDPAEEERSSRARVAASLIKTVEAMQHLGEKNRMTAWWRCRRLATQLPLFHPVQVVVALVSWGRVLLFRPSQPLGLASATVYLFAAVLALHVAAVLLLLKGTRIARDHTMWRRNAQLGRRQVQVSLVRVRWRLAAAAAVEGLLGVLFSFWSVAMGLGLAGADAAGTSSMLLLAWAPVGALSHLGMLFPLCFLLWRLRNALAWTRDPDTLEEQANLPGMRGVVENHIATAVGMATARMARAAAREMDGHVVQSLDGGIESRRQLYSAAKVGSRRFRAEDLQDIGHASSLAPASSLPAGRFVSEGGSAPPGPLPLGMTVVGQEEGAQPEAPSHQGPTGSRSMRNAVMAARAAQAFRKQAIKQMQGTGESDADEEGSARSARQVTKAPSMLRKLGKMASMRRVHPEPDLSAQDRAKELIRQAQLGKRLTAKDMALLASEVHRKASRSRTGSESGQQGPAGSHASAPQDHAHARIRAPSRLRPSSAFLRPGEAMPPDAHQPHGQDEGHGHQPQLRHRASMPGGTQRAMPAPVLVAPLSVSPPAPARYAVPATAGGSAVPTGNTTGFTYRGTTAAGPAFVRAAGPSRFAGPPSDVGANGGGDSSPGRAAGLGVPPRAPSRQSSGGAGGTLEAAVRRSVVGEDMLSVPPPVPEGQEVRMDDIEALGPHRWGAGGRWSRHGPSQDGGGASAHGGPRGTSQTGSDRQSQVAASGRQGLSRAVSGVSGTSSPGVPPPEERVAEAMDSSALVKVVTTRDGAVKWLRRNPSLIPQSAVQAAAARAPSESGAASLPETVIINGKRYRRKRKPSAAATTAAAPAPPDSSTVDPGFPRAAVQTTAGDGPGRHGEAQQGAEHRAFMSEGGGRMGVAAGWESSSSGGRGASNEGAGAEPSVGIAKAWASADGSPDSHSGKQVGRALGDVSLRRLVLAGGVEEGEGGEAGRAREGEQEEGRSAMRAEEGQQEGGGEELGGEVEGEEEGADGVLDGPREGADEETEGETGRDAQGALEEEEEDGDEALVMPQVDGSDDEVLEVGTGATPVRLPSVKGRSRQGSVAPDAMSVAGSSKSRPGKGKGGGKKKGTGKGKKGKGRAAAEPEKEVRVPRTDASKKAGGAVYGLKGLGYKEKEEGSARGRGGAVSKGAGTGRGKRK